MNYWQTPVFFKQKIFIPQKKDFIYKNASHPSTIDFDMDVHGEHTIQKCKTDALIPQRVQSTLDDVEFSREESERTISELNESSSFRPHYIAPIDILKKYSNGEY